MTITRFFGASAILPIALLACAPTGASAATAEPQEAGIQPPAAAAPAESRDRAVITAPQGGRTNLRITPVSLGILGFGTRR